MDMITMEYFVNEVKKEIERKLGRNYEVKTEKVNKNNDILLNAICIREEGKNTAPSIYLEKYYDAYKNNNADIDFITEKIIEVYNAHKTQQLEVNWIMNWELIKW